MNIPSIPDNFYKILVMLGLAIIIYSQYEYEKNFQKRQNEEIEYAKRIDDLNEKIAKNEFLLTQIKDKSNIISNRNDIENPLILEDTQVLFKRLIKGDSKSEKFNDSINFLFLEYKEADFYIKQLSNKIIAERKTESLKEEILKVEADIKDQYFDIGLVIVLLGGLGMYIQQSRNDKLLKLQISSYNSLYTNCQSCGKEFNLMIPKGTDSKGGIFDGFCIKCFENGQFTNPDLTKQDVLNDIFIRKNIKSNIIKKIIELRVSQLERWKV